MPEQPVLKSLAILLVVALGPSVSQAQSTGFEAPPVIETAQLTGDLVSPADFFSISPQSQTDGFMAPISIDTRYGAITASGPGMLDVRLNEIRAVAALDAIEANEQFKSAAQGEAMQTIGSIETLIESPVETLKGVPQGIGRFLDRTGRSLKTGIQKIEDVRKAPGEDQLPPQSWPLPGEAATSKGPDRPPLSLVIAQAGGEVALNVLGYDEQRRALARQLNVDPYSTNPILSQKLDDVTWSAFGGGLGVHVLTSMIPGGMVVSTSSTVTDWVWNTKPGDIRVNVVGSLRAVGVPESEIELLLRHPHFPLSMQQVLAESIDRLDGVSGLQGIVPLALSARSEGQARFVVQSVEMLSNAHDGSTPLVSVIVNGTVGAIGPDNSLVVPMPADTVSWSPSLATLIDLFATTGVASATLHVSGSATDIVKSELQARGWTTVVESPISPVAYPIR